MSASIIATIIVIALLLFFLIWGFHRGFFRILLTTMTLIVTIALAGAIAPKCSKLIADSFIGKSVEKSISSFLEKNIDNPAVNSVIPIQEEVIGRLPLPQFLKNELVEKNTPSEYAAMQVGSFTDFLKEKLVGAAVNYITFGILVILIYILLRVLLRVSRVINNLPVIGGINRLFGAIFGAAEGLLIIWCVCIVITLISGTQFGMQATEVINSNAFLRFFYEKNGILMGVNALFQSLIK